MDTLWAPWRMEYIRQPKTGGCFLCANFRSSEDRANLVLHRGETCGLVMNRYPYNNGHLMVAPYRHIASMHEMTDAERLEMMRLSDRGIAALRSVVRPDGFNLGINLGRVAGAGLETHLHLHIVPRWSGDTNFMPVVGHTKIVPQALEDLGDQLRAALGG